MIENNQYAMGTSVARSAAGLKLCDRGAAYGIPGQQVDGMDVVKVKEAAAHGVWRMRVRAKAPSSSR